MLNDLKKKKKKARVAYISYITATYFSELKPIFANTLGKRRPNCLTPVSMLNLDGHKVFVSWKII